MVNWGSGLDRGEVPGALTVKTARDGDDAVLLLRGELDSATVEVVSDALERLESDPLDRLVIDLRGLLLIDATGLRLIKLVRARCLMRGGPELEIRRGRLASNGYDDVFGSCVERPATA